MISPSWEKLLKNGIRAALVLSVIMPLVVEEGYAFLSADQVFFIQTIVLMVLGMFAALIVLSRRKSYLPKITPLTLGCATFVASFFIAAFAGVNWHMGLWGSLYFMKGAVFLLFGFCYYLMISQIFSTWDDWRWLLRFIAGVGGIVVLLGIIFGAVLSENGFCHLIAVRMGSVLGNPVFLGGYSMMVFFLGLLGLAMERSFPFRIFFVICSSLSFLGVLLSGTRSAMLGLAVGLALILFFYGFKIIREKKIFNEFKWIIFIILTALFVLAVWQGTCCLLNQKDTALVSGIARAHSANFESRFIVWQGAIRAWLEKPLFGWGPNNFEYAFSSYYQPEIFLYSEALAWPDGVWNVWLEALVERGILGLIALFALLAAVIWSLFVGYKRGRLPFFGLAIGTAFLFAYFIHLSFIFELVSMSMLFFIFLAFVNSTTISRSSENGFLFFTGRQRFFVLTIFISLLLVIFIFVALLPTAANTIMHSAILLFEDQPDRAMEIHNRVAENIPTPYLSELQLIFFVSGLPYLDKWEKEQADRFAHLGLAAFYRESGKEMPRISFLLHQAELARQASYLLDKDSLLKDAEDFLGKAYLLSPKRQQTIFLLATVKMELGDFEKAYQLVKEGIEITPTAPQGWLRLIWIHKMNDDEESAREVFQEAQDRDITFKLKDVEKVNQILSPECCNRGEIF